MKNEHISVQMKVGSDSFSSAGSAEDVFRALETFLDLIDDSFDDEEEDDQ